MNELLIHFGKIDFDLSISSNFLFNKSNYFVIPWNKTSEGHTINVYKKCVINVYTKKEIKRNILRAEKDRRYNVGRKSNRPKREIEHSIFLEGSTPELCEELYNRIDKIYKLTHKILYDISVIVGINEVNDRIEEFDVIKDNKLDLISLNSLFDYYGKEFNEQDYII